MIVLPVPGPPASRKRSGCNDVGVCAKAAYRCAVPVCSASRIEPRHFRRHTALDRNLKRGKRGGRRRSGPETSLRMRHLIPTLGIKSREDGMRRSVS